MAIHEALNASISIITSAYIIPRYLPDPFIGLLENQIFERIVVLGNSLGVAP